MTIHTSRFGVVSITAADVIHFSEGLLGFNELHRFVLLDVPAPQQFAQNKDVVIWYGAHFTHDVTHELPGVHGHIVGPILKPVNW